VSAHREKAARELTDLVVTLSKLARAGNGLTVEERAWLEDVAKRHALMAIAIYAQHGRTVPDYPAEVANGTLGRAAQQLDVVADMLDVPEGEDVVAVAAKVADEIELLDKLLEPFREGGTRADAVKVLLAELAQIDGALGLYGAPDRSPGDRAIKIAELQGKLAHFARILAGCEGARPDPHAELAAIDEALGLGGEGRTRSEGDRVQRIEFLTAMAGNLQSELEAACWDRDKARTDNERLRVRLDEGDLEANIRRIAAELKRLRSCVGDVDACECPGDCPYSRGYAAGRRDENAMCQNAVKFASEAAVWVRP